MMKAALARGQLSPEQYSTCINKWGGVSTAVGNYHMFAGGSAGTRRSSTRYTISSRMLGQKISGAAD